MQIVDPNNPIPKYLQISTWLTEAIQIGRYPLGDKIPSEVELSRMCRVNRNTLRQAIAELTKNGLLAKKKGQGTFVTASEPSALKHQLNRISSFSKELSAADGVIESLPRSRIAPVHRGIAEIRDDRHVHVKRDAKLRTQE